MKSKWRLFIFTSFFLGVFLNAHVSVSQPLATTAIPGRASGVSVSGSFAYVVSNLSLQSINIADPANPVTVDSRALPSFAWNVTATGGNAYVADGYSGLRIFSPSVNPPSHWDESAMGIKNFATDVAVDDDKGIICVTSSGYFFNDGGFHVIQNRQMIGTVQLPDNATGVALAGNYAFVADGPAGMIAIDISVPENPEIIGVVGAGGDINDVAADGLKVFAADRVNGLISIDASDPTNPQIVGSVHAPGATDVALVANKALVAVGSAGIRVVNVSNPAAPFLMASLPVPGSATDVAGVANTIYVADETAGLVVLAMPGDLYPYITSVSAPQTLNGETSATIRAEVAPVGGVSITRVWMEIRPPNASAPITVDMTDPDNNAVYEGTHASFVTQGNYEITVQASDNQGGTSVLMHTTVTQNGSAPVPTPTPESGGGGGSGCFLDAALGD